MARTALTPVFAGVRTGLHVLFLVLAVVVLARSVLVPTPSSGAVIALVVLLIGTYAVGPRVNRGAGARRRGAGIAWLGVLTVQWALLLWLIPDAAYLIFPMFFLYLHILGPRRGIAAVTITAILSICGLALHSGWTVGGAVGPLVGAGVAILIGLGYSALANEAEQREALVLELRRTRGQLAATEHEAGVLAERGRLAREIHDTVAQGLSSIQMLLHAAEQIDPERPGVDHIRLARETAAANLADTRRFIRELAPRELEDDGLGGALRRLAQSQWSSQGLDVRVRVSDVVTLPMHFQTALLRIAQGAVANIIQHAGASTATISLSQDGADLRFTIVDDGVGFDPALVAVEAEGRTDSFGLRAARERVQQLGGAFTIDSAPGRGTTLTVSLSREDA